MKRNLFLISYLLGAGMVLSACAARLDEVDDKVIDLQKRTASLEAKLGNPIGSDRELLAGEKLADVRSQVAAMRNDVTVLSGKVEALEFDSKNMSTRIDQLSQELIAKTAELEKHMKQAPSPEPQTGSLFDRALRAHQDGDFDASLKLFDEFITKSPKSPLKPTALYWMGEGYMAKKQYRKAVVKFQEIVDKFPKSEKKCEAMAQQIQALKDLKMLKEANAFTKVRNAECH